MCADVNQAVDVQGAVSETVGTNGRLDLLFTSAGIGGGGTVADIPEEAWDRMVDPDLKAV